MRPIHVVFASFFYVFNPSFLPAQSPDRVEPPFWWTDMKNPTLQLLVHGDQIASLDVSITAYPGLELKQVTTLQSPNYLVLDLLLKEGVQPGTFQIRFKKGNKTVFRYDYQLKQREPGSAERQGFSSSDVLYLVTPDRFVNGNPANDEVAGMKEKPNRAFQGGRHGGDIAGLSQSLGYIRDMGYTAIWLNPVLENDQPDYSYHGYATTDYYKVDPRYGSNDEYLAFSRKAREYGIGLIMDMIVNHCGSSHWWMDDLPASDWLNYQQEFLEGEYHITTHRKTITQDPYASKGDTREFVDGWFVPTMPDLNQRNPFMARYLIQNTIWWVEYAGITGIRMDTYPYPDKAFMAEWTCQVMNEYPNFNIVGEEWNETPAIVAHWQRGKSNPGGYTSCLPGLMDFPLQAKVTQGLMADETNWSGLVYLYEALANDFTYADPSNLVIFPDNHDMSRFYTQVNESYDLFRLGITYYLTTRGIPQLYYGTEILMTNPGTTDHGIIRSDFPGGWEGDTISAFTGQGLSSRQLEAQDFLRKLLNWRKDNTVIHTGKLMHFNPKNGIYVLVRYTDDRKVMVVLSKNTQDTDLELARFREVIGNSQKGFEVLTGQSLDMTQTLRVPAMTPMVIEVR